MTVSPMYGHELRSSIIAALAALPMVARINYLEYWNDQTFLIFLDPCTETTRTEVESRLNELLLSDLRGRSSGVRWRFFSVIDPVPSSATLYRRD